jgi:hypothetical protein
MQLKYFSSFLGVPFFLIVAGVWRKNSYFFVTLFKFSFRFILLPSFCFASKGKEILFPFRDFTTLTL